MPNWCKGSLKVRGKISDLKEFVQQGLEPVSYIGDALEPLVFTTEDETSFFVMENKVSLWMKGPTAISVSLIILRFTPMIKKRPLL